jgi:hypothetical protein
MKTQYFSITKINLLLLYTEIICIYSETHNRHVNTLRGRKAYFFLVVLSALYI